MVCMVQIIEKYFKVLQKYFTMNVVQMTVEQKKSRQQSSYFPETKASLKKKYYGEFGDVSVIVLSS